MSVERRTGTHGASARVADPVPGAFLATSRPDIGALEAEALTRTLKRGYFGMGPEVRAFEQELENYLGPDRTVLCVSSGTAALHLAMAALEIGPGDEVLVPSLTYAASFQAVAMTGARPVACDVLRSSGLLDVDDARTRCSAATRAIMPVHYAGNLEGQAELYQFANQSGLRVIEDAAHAFGSTLNGIPAGASGDITCFSFDPIKNITSGQGGAVVTSDTVVAKSVVAMRNLGIEHRDVSSAEAYEVHGSGWRYQMSDLMACIGRVQLARFEAEIKPARVELARTYRARLATISGIKLLSSAAGTVPHIFPILVARSRRDAVRAALAEAGFQTRVHYKPNHLHPAFSDGQPRPVAEALHAELITLPTHAGVTPDHVEAIARILEHSAGVAPAKDQS